MPTPRTEPSTLRRAVSKVRDRATRTHPAVWIAVASVAFYVLVRFGGAFLYDVTLRAIGIERAAAGPMPIVLISLLAIFGLLASFSIVLGLAVFLGVSRLRAGRARSMLDHEGWPRTPDR